MKQDWNSRRRMLAALECQAPDQVPCAFMMYKGLKNECRDYPHFLQEQLDLGLDVVVELPPRPPLVANEHPNLHGLPVRYAPAVRTLERLVSDGNGGRMLVKEYATPDGILSVELPGIVEWQYGPSVPFLDDHIIALARKHLVEHPADLLPLRHLLAPLSEQEVGEYRRQSQPYLDFAERHGLLVAGGWGVGADMVAWLCGLKNIILFTYRQPEFLHQLLEMVAAWNISRMQAAFSLPLDLYIKRAWYENCVFWTPASWRRFLQPILRREVALAHEAGVKFGYLITSSAMPLIDGILETGVDVLIGVDPREFDLPALKHKVAGRMCLWGGVNGHITVETGTPAEVAAETRRAMQELAPGGGVILSPVDNVRSHTPSVRENVASLISTWRECIALPCV